MLKYLEPLDWFPTADELVTAENTPVDGELQESIPSLLKHLLGTLFSDRTDWFFGINMGIFYDPDLPPVIPNAFLSIGVETIRADQETLRSSYLLWEENGIIPQIVIEVVSQKYQGEYGAKKDLYEDLGVLYYLVYNPNRRLKSHLEMYRLVNGKYELVRDDSLWMPEIGLGVGTADYCYNGVTRKWLFWQDEQSNRYQTPQEQFTQTQIQLQAEQARSQRLADRLRELGINPDEI
jgi:Uma2 family endonuclease